jgi:hypothetical protein
VKYPNGPGDVLDRLLTHIVEGEIELVAHDPADADSTGFGQGFKPRCDIDAIAENAPSSTIAGAIGALLSFVVAIAVLWITIDVSFFLPKRRRAAREQALNNPAGQIKTELRQGSAGLT